MVYKKMFITISPPFRHGDLSYTFIDDRLQIITALKRIKRYIIYPELDPKGRLHYHGILTLSDSEYVSFYKECRKKIEHWIGFVDVKPILSLTENIRTIIYMTKEWGITKDILSIEKPIMHESKTRTRRLCQPTPLDNGITLESYGFKIQL